MACARCCLTTSTRSTSSALTTCRRCACYSGFWAKQLRDPWLNCAEAGYDPTAVPEINDSNMALAYTNREGAHYNGRPEINEIDTFYRNIYDDEGSLADGERLHNYELALMTLASLVDPKLADFNDAYWHFVEENEG